MLSPQNYLVCNTNTQFMTKDITAATTCPTMLSTTVCTLQLDICCHWTYCYLYKRCLIYFNI